MLLLPPPTPSLSPFLCLSSLFINRMKFHMSPSFIRAGERRENYLLFFISSFPLHIVCFSCSILILQDIIFHLLKKV